MGENVKDRNCEWPPTTPPKHMIGSKFQKDYLSALHRLQNTTVEYEWSGEYFNDIRKTFLRGEWPENCKRCKHVESLGGTSKRMDENHMWYDKFKHLIDSTNDDGTVNYLPPHMDVRTGSVCNFKCIHCGPGASSRWMEDYDLIKSYGYNLGIPENAWIAKDSKFWDEIDISNIQFPFFEPSENLFGLRYWGGKRSNNHNTILPGNIFSPRIYSITNFYRFSAGDKYTKKRKFYYQ